MMVLNILLNNTASGIRRTKHETLAPLGKPL